MIVTEQKNLEELLDSLGNEKTIFLIGCRLCAAVYKTGGPAQVEEMRKKLEAKGKIVTGSTTVATVCHASNVEREFDRRMKEVSTADAVLVLACGEGTQTVGEVTDKPVYAALNTLFLGALKEDELREHCTLCGECILNLTGGICPVTRCAKGILNGPCGGTNDGKCEVDSAKDCAWVLIYDRLKKRSRLDRIKAIFPPRDFSKTLSPRSTRVGEKGVAE